MVLSNPDVSKPIFQGSTKKIFVSSEEGKDLYREVVNAYFLELQQKNVVAGENCPYVSLTTKLSGAGAYSGTGASIIPNVGLSVGLSVRRKKMCVEKIQQILSVLCEMMKYKKAHGRSL